MLTNSKAKLGSPPAASSALIHLSLLAPVNAIKLLTASSSTYGTGYYTGYTGTGAATVTGALVGCNVTAGEITLLGASAASGLAAGLGF